MGVKAGLDARVLIDIIDVAMMDTAMVMQAPQVSGYLVNGVQPELFGNRSPTRSPTANVFATASELKRRHHTMGMLSQSSSGRGERGCRRS